jgi:hypothetical protein
MRPIRIVLSHRQRALKLNVCQDNTDFLYRFSMGRGSSPKPAIDTIVKVLERNYTVFEGRKQRLRRAKLRFAYPHT